jgi:hypothetical protein
MISLEDECVGCPAELGCLGNSCPYKNVPRFYCDGCGNEAKLYWYDGEQLCIDCIECRLERVEYCG